MFSGWCQEWSHQKRTQMWALTGVSKEETEGFQPVCLVCCFAVAVVRVRGVTVRGGAVRMVTVTVMMAEVGVR